MPIRLLVGILAMTLVPTLVQADALLRSPLVWVGLGDSYACQILNVSKKTIPRLNVRCKGDDGFESAFSSQVNVAPGHGHAGCGVGGFTAGYCEFEVLGANAKAVRASLTVRNSNFTSVLVLPATQ